MRDFDDQPTLREPAPRRSFAYGDADGGFGGRPTRAPAPAPVAGPPIDAIVKWFKADKGYGFVELANGQGDAFLHAHALNASGHGSVPAGAKLKVMVGAGLKGAQVTQVLQVDTADVPEPSQGSLVREPRARRAAPDPSTAVSLSGAVKWFDEIKGFGFVVCDDGGRDVFVHISILGPSRISRLSEGQRVNMRVVETPKGREAIAISL